MNKILKNKKGFTLIELIVVIAILGILAMIAIPRFAGFQEAAKHKADVATGKSIATIISAEMATGKLTIPVPTPIPLGSTGVSNLVIIESFPAKTVPKVQSTLTGTTAKAFYYTFDITNGDVRVYADNATPAAGTTMVTNQLYPVIGSTFQ